MVDPASPRFCPVQEVKEQLAFPYEEIDPLLQHLAANRPAEEQLSFGRGTITTSGKLDCCKQDLGPVGATLLTQALATNTQIKSILFGTGGIGNEGAKSVGDLLQKNQAIRTVYLGCNLIESTGVEQIALGLERNQAVTALWLKRNPIGEKGAFAIAKLLTKKCNIFTLDLVNTSIGYQGLKALVNVLIKEKYPLRRLSIGGNGFGPEAAELLAQLLANTESLNDLLLSANHLGDSGVQLLTEALQQNGSLKYLAVGSNGMTDNGVAHCFEQLARHTSLQRLALGRVPSTEVLNAQSNEIGIKSAEAIASFVADNESLCYLDLRGNCIPYRSWKKIKDSLVANKSLQELVIGKGHSRPLKEAIKNILERNRVVKKVIIPQDVEDIRSVYR